MVLNILLGAVAVILIGFAIILISPFSCVLHFKRILALECASAKMYWLHPWILCGLVDLKKKFLDIRLFGRFVIYSKSTDKEDIDGAAEKGGNAPAGPLDGKAVPPHRETDTGTVYGPAGSTQQAGHLHPQSPGLGKPDAAPVGEEKKKKEGPVVRLRSIQERIRNSSLQKGMFFLRQESWRHKIYRWLGRTIPTLFHLFTMHRLKIYVRASLPEPSATGKIYGYWMGISHALMIEKMKKREIVFKPAFNEECFFEVEALLHIKTSLIRFMVPVVIMLVTFPYFSTFRVWRASRKMTRKEKRT